jgi:hypothetical protein
MRYSASKDVKDWAWYYPWPNPKGAHGARAL